MRHCRLSRIRSCGDAGRQHCKVSSIEDFLRSCGSCEAVNRGLQGFYLVWLPQSSTVSTLIMRVAFACRALIPGALLVLAAVCSTQAQAASLYERMGGKPVVTAVVVDMQTHALADPLLAPYFQGSNMHRIRDKLVEQICQLGGGGCQYTGDSMRETHAEHHITQAAFYRLVEVLRDAMRRQHVHLRERNELLALLAPMERDVVNVPAPKADSSAPTAAAAPAQDGP